MKTIEQKPNETRKQYLVRVAIEMLIDNAFSMDWIVYDNVECNALCLAADLADEFNSED